MPPVIVFPFFPVFFRQTSVADVIAARSLLPRLRDLGGASFVPYLHLAAVSRMFVRF